LFRRTRALTIFARVFREAGLRFVFEVRDLHLEDDWLTFYIKPEDGFELPKIMKWMKQVFAQGYNRATGRIGHIWGDRYWSRIVEGEPRGQTPGDCGGCKASPEEISVKPKFPGAKCLISKCYLYFSQNSYRLLCNLYQILEVF
jgi:hypothetical protein